MIKTCLSHLTEEDKQEHMVGYVTIHESFVKAATSQRRRGLHIEAPNAHKLGQIRGIAHRGLGKVDFTSFPTFWGEGIVIDNTLYGGIFMASNIAHSCGVRQMEDSFFVDIMII
jgi:hypothetical protein